MYLFGNESIGKLIKEFKENYYNLKLDYDYDNTDVIEERVILETKNIKYIIGLEDGEYWYDRFIYKSGKLNPIEIVELQDRNIEITKNIYADREVKIVMYKNKANLTYTKYLLNVKIHRKIESENIFEKDILISEFTYTTEQDSKYANIIIDFVENNNLNFLYYNDIHGKNKRKYIIEVNSIDEFNNYNS